METNKSANRTPVLLFVEDDDDAAFLFCKEFEKLAPNWEIICTSNGLAASHKLANSHMPQVLVTDLNMPGMGGLELIEWIKAQPRFRLLPIVVLSNSNDPSHRQRCATLGVSSYLDKTASLKVLRENILYILKFGETSRFRSPEQTEDPVHESISVSRNPEICL